MASSIRPHIYFTIIKQAQLNQTTTTTTSSSSSSSSSNLLLQVLNSNTEARSNLNVNQNEQHDWIYAPKPIWHGCRGLGSCQIPTQSAAASRGPRGPAAQRTGQTQCPASATAGFLLRCSCGAQAAVPETQRARLAPTERTLGEKAAQLCPATILLLKFRVLRCMLHRYTNRATTPTFAKRAYAFVSEHQRLILSQKTHALNTSRSCSPDLT